MTTKNERVFNHAQINTALNEAADQILELAGLGDEGDPLTDAINLLVNAAQHYLDNPDDTLADVVDANYGDADEEDNVLARLTAKV